MPAEGFRAAQAYVEVTARLDERQLLAESRRAAEGVEDELRDGGRRAGASLTRELGRAGKDASEALVRSTEDGLQGAPERFSRRLRDDQGRFLAAGRSVGEDVAKGATEAVEEKAEPIFTPMIRKSKKVGSDVGGGLLAGLGPKLADGLSGSLVAAAAPAMVLLAPTLASTISAAVVGGAGIGGVVGGLVLAARDPRVKAAGTDLGQFLLADLEARSQDFVPEMLTGIQKVRSAWVDMGPDLDRIFASSRLVQPLVDGALAGGKKIVHGIADAIESSDGPVLAFGRMFDAIGTSSENFFTTMAGDAKETSSAIDDLTGSVTNLMDTATQILHYGAQIKGAADGFDVLIDKGRYWVEDYINSGDRFRELGIKVDLTADGFKNGTAEAEAYRKATLGTAEVADFAILKHAGLTDATIAQADASGTYRQVVGEVNRELGITQFSFATSTDALKIMNSSMADGIKMAGGLSAAFMMVNGGALSARDAEAAYQAAVDGLTASVRENGKGLNKQKTDFDLNTAAGRANNAAMEKLITTTDQKAQATYDEVNATQGAQAAQAAATKVYADGRAQLIKNLTTILGNKDAAVTLANKIMAIPKKWDTKITADTGPAITAANALVARINSMHARIGVGLYGSGAYGGSYHSGEGNSGGMASGGEVTGGSGYKDDVPILAMGGEFMLQKRAVNALKRQFGPDFLRELNNWHTGGKGAPVTHLTGHRWKGLAARQLPDPATTPPATTIPPPQHRPPATTIPPAPKVIHIGQVVLDASGMKSIQDVVELIGGIEASARAYSAA